MCIYSELQVNYSNLPALRTLVSGIPIPREGEDIDDILITVTPTPYSSEPAIPQHWQSLLVTLTKLHGEGTKDNSIRNPHLNYKIIQLI